MPILKFRISWEEDEGVYRDIVIKPEQTFLHLHEAILGSFGFDNKHQATFFRSNDHWQRGREILLEKDTLPHKAEPMLMADTIIADVVRNPNQKFIYVYDYVKRWTFTVELIGVLREENGKLDYPACVRKEGLAPSQYGTKGIIKDKIVETEEKYDLNAEQVEEGFGEEGENLEEEGGTEEESF